MTAHDFGVDALLGNLSDHVGLLEPTTPEQDHAAALTIAERALAEEWPHGDVRQVLDALGIGERS